MLDLDANADTYTINSILKKLQIENNQIYVKMEEKNLIDTYSQEINKMLKFNKFTFCLLEILLRFQEIFKTQNLLSLDDIYNNTYDTVNPSTSK